MICFCWLDVVRPVLEYMLASVLIISVSLVLLIYWFRYTCLLLLNANTAFGHAGSMARANRLAFPHVQKALETQPDEAALDALYQSLENDHRIILYLLRHSAGFELPAVEQTMLVLDYRMMRLWYQFSRRGSIERARQALVEMSQVLAYFSDKMGEHAAQHAAA